MVLLRFAPSPTGALHLGGLRTALFNHLYTRNLGGKVDIEDRRHRRDVCCLAPPTGCSDWILTDRQTRYVPGSVEGIRESLAWAGLDYGHGAHISTCASSGGLY